MVVLWNATSQGVVLELDAEYSETKNFVDFLHDDVYDEDGIMVAEAPKVHSVWAALAIVAMAKLVCARAPV